MRHHLLGRNPNGFRDVVWNVEIGGPDGSDTLRHGCRPSVGLDGVPEERSHQTYNDCEAAEVPSKGGTHGNGEGHMKTSADDTVEDKRYSADYATEDDAVDCFSPRRR